MDKLTITPLPEDMSQLKVDFRHPNRTLIHGCFRETVTVRDEERAFYTYIPKDLEYCQPCLVVAPPSREEPLDYLERSGLRRLAEARQLYLFLLIPREGG